MNCRTYHVVKQVVAQHLNKTIYIILAQVSVHTSNEELEQFDELIESQNTTTIVYEHGMWLNDEYCKLYGNDVNDIDKVVYIYERTTAVPVYTA